MEIRISAPVSVPFSELNMPLDTKTRGMTETGRTTVS